MSSWREKLALEKNTHEKALQRGSIPDDKQGWSEDLIRLQPRAPSSKRWFNPGSFVTLVNPRVNLVSVQKDTVEFPLWDLCVFHYGNNGVAGANCSHSRSSWFCFYGETRYSVRPILTHAHTVKEIYWRTDVRDGTCSALGNSHTAVFKGNSTRFSYVCNGQIG